MITQITNVRVDDFTRIRDIFVATAAELGDPNGAFMVAKRINDPLDRCDCIGKTTLSAGECPKKLMINLGRPVSKLLGELGYSTADTCICFAETWNTYANDQLRYNSELPRFIASVRDAAWLEAIKPQPQYSLCLKFWLLDDEMATMRAGQFTDHGIQEALVRLIAVCFPEANQLEQSILMTGNVVTVDITLDSVEQLIANTTVPEMFMYLIGGISGSISVSATTPFGDRCILWCDNFGEINA